MPRLPDLLTTANLCCGVGSILLASQGQFTLACGLVFLAAVFDVFDGLAARALGGGSPLGAQLDSLADMVSFGVAPGMLVWFAFGVDIEAEHSGWSVIGAIWHNGGNPKPYAVALLSMMIIVPSAWRLAKFNVDTRQTSGFLGLPTPANGLFWASLILSITAMVRPGLGALNGFGAASIGECIYALIHRFQWLSVVGLLLGVLMLSELPLPSLKFKSLKWRGNEVIFLLIGIGAVLAVLYGILAVPLILVLYLLSPLWGKLFAASSPKP